MNRHAWLQKHPSPLAAGGEFHWNLEVDDRELRVGGEGWPAVRAR